MRNLLLTILAFYLFACQPKKDPANNPEHLFDNLIKQINEETVNRARTDTLPEFELIPCQTKQNSSRTPDKTSRGTCSVLADTIIVRRYELIAYPIIELYSHVFEPDSITFVYSDPLDLAIGDDISQLYNLSYCYTRAKGDYQTFMLTALDKALGLKTTVQKETIDILVLDSIDVSKGYLKLSCDKALKDYISGGCNSSISLVGSGIEVSRITEVLEDVFEMPVKSMVSREISCDVNISIINSGMNLDDWLQLLNEKGIILRKTSQQVIKSVRIDRVV